MSTDGPTTVGHTTEPTNYRDVTEDVLDNRFRGRTFTIEDGTVWVSGQNPQCWRVAEAMARCLVHHDVPCSLVYDDGAAEHGGVQFNYGRGA
jgi:hypothetical protein